MRIMRAERALWANDFRHIVRDRTVSVLLFIPVILIGSLRFAVPLIERQFPIVGGYRPHLPRASLAVGSHQGSGAGGGQAHAEFLR